jgi:hypothetical protein
VIVAYLFVGYGISELRLFPPHQMDCIFLLYRAFNQGGNREESVESEQHFSRIAALTADSRMSH